MTIDYIQKEALRLRERLIFEGGYSINEIEKMNKVVDFILFGTISTDKMKDNKYDK